MGFLYAQRGSRGNIARKRANSVREKKKRKKKEKEKLVIQGSHMVSGTRCPAWSDQLKKWGESRAAAPKGQCPVEHRGEPICPPVSNFRLVRSSLDLSYLGGQRVIRLRFESGCRGLSLRLKICLGLSSKADIWAL